MDASIAGLKDENMMSAWNTTMSIDWMADWCFTACQHKTGHVSYSAERGRIDSDKQGLSMMRIVYHIIVMNAATDDRYIQLA